MAKHRIFVMRFEPCGCLFEMLGRPEGAWGLDLQGSIAIKCPHGNRVVAQPQAAVALKDEP